MLLAAITEEYNEAMRYLIHARNFLRLFREKQNEVTPRILSMDEISTELKKTSRRVREPGFNLEAIRHHPPHVQLLYPKHLGAFRRVNPGHLDSFRKARRAHRSNRVQSPVIRKRGCLLTTKSREEIA